VVAFVGRTSIRRNLTLERCIPAVRQAMIDLSLGHTRQALRQIVPIDDRGLLGSMQGALRAGSPFGAKVLSVFPENVARGGQSHQGLILLFDRETGAPTHVVHAGEITAIRTAAASAVATEALARPDARRLAILGTGEQARAHSLAICAVRPIEEVVLWGRSADKARALAHELQELLQRAVAVAATPSEAARDSDVICTVTAASDPLLDASDVAQGAHLNVVGSSHLGPREVDNDLVARARYFADHRVSVLAQGAELQSAISNGLVAEDHLLAEIGEVLCGAHPGRAAPEDVTLYKSLGNIVQDLACAALVASIPDARAIELDD
jgi:ornithine cyclodeaminase